jgi:cephalosporin-C deacetylase
MLPALVLAALFANPASAAADRPKEFDQFWESTRRRLAATPLDPTLAPDPEHTDGEVACFKASYASLHGKIVHARYCRPSRDGKFPAALVNPWYSQAEIPAPVDLAKRGFAALEYQARGFEVDQSSYPTSNSWYILEGIQLPENYVYREIVSHALRGLDFLASRPEADMTRVGVMGASQGGGLSLLVGGLDKRVTAVAADFPFLTDWPDSLSAETSPYADVRKYLTDLPAERKNVMITLSYFDTLDVADRIDVPVLVQVGLKDKTCPPAEIKTMYGRLKSRVKKLKEYPDADHTDRGGERWKTSIDFLAETLGGR